MMLERISLESPLNFASNGGFRFGIEQKVGKILEEIIYFNFDYLL